MGHTKWLFFQENPAYYTFNFARFFNIFDRFWGNNAWRREGLLNSSLRMFFKFSSVISDLLELGVQLLFWHACNQSLGKMKKYAHAPVSFPDDTCVVYKYIMNLSRVIPWQNESETFIIMELMNCTLGEALFQCIRVLNTKRSHVCRCCDSPLSVFLWWGAQCTWKWGGIKRIHYHYQWVC